MVGRLRPAAVVDLDGTLLRCNSLHAYIKAGCRQLMRRGQLLRLGRVAGWLMLRKLGLAAHPQMKWGCARAIGFGQPVLEALASDLRPQWRTDLIQWLQGWQAETGGLVLVATAAFADYARALLPQWPMVATDFANANHAECRGEAKLAAASQWLDVHDAYLSLAISDHADDTPLLSAAPQSILIEHGQFTPPALP